MLTLPAAVRIYVAADPVDLRRGCWPQSRTGEPLRHRWKKGQAQRGQAVDVA